ncbi:MAG TPA: di-heme oxidoredictase family protein [Polyangia bacterium]|nr:di-heme oxidoredictase family protein [Polyangia bacterium]
MAATANAQLVDRNLAPNISNEGVAKTFAQQIGAGRGTINTPDSSLYIIARDPARAVRRGRQLFQRKFTVGQGLGPRTGDGTGDINSDLSVGAGLADSCAGCHGRPRGAAGFGGDVATRPDSRDAPHLFGLGLKEMLADEITTELRTIKAQTVDKAVRMGRRVSRVLTTSQTKGAVNYGTIIANPDGSVDTSQVVGVNADLRVRPFFAHGGTISIREFAVGAFNAEMGLEAADPDLLAARGGARVVTPAGMVLDGASDQIEGPPASSPADDPDGDGKVNEIPTSIVDFMEFYLLNYFKAGNNFDGLSHDAQDGRNQMSNLGCTTCHVATMTIERDRRVADFETVFDATRGNPFNRLFATATTLFTVSDDHSGLPTLKRPAQGRFEVKNIYTDFKRHDLGPNFYERNYDGTTQKQFLTTPLWGVGTSAPYGHDGRSPSLTDVILRHGGEAQAARDRFNCAGTTVQRNVLLYLATLILFPPDDTASTLQPITPTATGYPQFGHGALRLSTLFNSPADPE